MLTMRMKKLIVGVAVLVAPMLALAQSPAQLIEKYTPLVSNNPEFAKVLVTGLRDGTEVVFKAGRTPRNWISFTPPTGKMGYGNVDNALTLAQGSLASLNIVTGTPQSGQRAVTLFDVKAVLMGGNVTTPQNTTITLPGVLILRSQDLGWGEISQKLNVKL
ncbi:MAG: hypothetical protein EPO20_10925 [Betaproteobacteria bacterium]|nr:MAG: hypothetical protein EPO20_10925 [Betaproteobacteria bacterium]